MSSRGRGEREKSESAAGTLSRASEREKGERTAADQDARLAKRLDGRLKHSCDPAPEPVVRAVLALAPVLARAELGERGGDRLAVGRVEEGRQLEVDVGEEGELVQGGNVGRERGGGRVRRVGGEGRLGEVVCVRSRGRVSDVHDDKVARGISKKARKRAAAHRG